LEIQVSGDLRDAFAAHATRTPVDARALALSILAALASVLVLKWAQAFVVPLLLGIVICYTLNPPVGWLEAIKIARVADTVILMAAMIGALVLGAYSRGQMQTIIEPLPEAATQFATGVARVKVVKVVSQHVEQLHPVAELLGD